ncbi:MAG: hypothetical protein ABID61_05685 [Candidatus Micrarchaeota archaeon]
MKKIIVVLVFAILFLLVINIFFLYSIATIRDELTSQKSDFESEKSILAAQIIDINDTVNQKDQEIIELNSQIEADKLKIDQTTNLLTYTQQQLNLTKSELSNTSLSLEEAQSEFSIIKSEIDDIAFSINESIQWFNSNSHLGPSTEFFSDYVYDKCVHSDTLNLPCIEFFMEKRLDFFYEEESPDKLYSIDEMISRGGGDCEDYSLFLKAVLNDLKLSDPDLQVMGWTKGDNNFMVYEGSSSSWFFKNAQPVYFGSLSDRYPVVFCYVTSYTDEELRGHCIVALSKEKIETKADLYKLNGAATFEPQDGEYKGTISNDYFLCGGEDCGKSTHDIILIITDDDFYKMVGGEWQSLAFYLNEITQFKAKLG